MGKKKEYTFEDWLNDSKSYYSARTYDSNGIMMGDMDVIKTGDFPEVLLKREEISEKSFQKIRHEQERAYDIATEFYINKQLKALDHKLEEISNTYQFLEQRKKHLLDIFEKTDPEIMESISSGDKDLQPITSVAYKRIINNIESPPTLKHIPPKAYVGSDPLDNNPEISPTFRIVLLFEEFMYIEELLESAVNKTDSDLLHEFVKRFSETTNYPAQLILEYLQNWIDYKGLSYPRAKAKRKLEEQDLTIPADGTLENWETKWEKFSDARTEN